MQDIPVIVNWYTLSMRGARASWGCEAPPPVPLSVYTLAPDLWFEDRAHSFNKPTETYDCFAVFLWKIGLGEFWPQDYPPNT